VVLHNGEQISVEMLPPPLNVGLPSAKRTSVAARASDAPVAPPTDSPSSKPLWLVEKEAIECAIDHCGGNIPRAAALLEVSPSTIYRKRQAWASEED
jgi:DNA-binding NtrC family response regulator